MSLRDKMLAVMADVNASVAEREELVELIAIALLTRKNLFILGDPGQAMASQIVLLFQHQKFLKSPFTFFILFFL